MTQIREMGKERYGLALTLILASMVFIMASPDGRWAEVIALTLQAFALFASLRAAQPSFHLRVTCGVLISLVMVVAWTQASFGDTVNSDFVHIATVALVLIATPVIVWGLIRQVRERGSITVHTMMGVLCIYLLMSLAFASAFAAVSQIDNAAFFKQGPDWDSVNNYLYYSLTTITTMGIGDLTPNTDLGRSLTAAEALFGQIYLVTVVAVIVANLKPKRTNG
ncbi:MAG: two pore domain potassium channel family protein [Solirubrobacterales bacterium]|nr:two pore domain potassium channel family protein [Solirubrobacterales bacterium]